MHTLTLTLTHPRPVSLSCLYLIHNSLFAVPCRAPPTPLPPLQMEPLGSMVAIFGTAFLAPCVPKVSIAPNDVHPALGIPVHAGDQEAPPEVPWEEGFGEAEPIVHSGSGSGSGTSTGTSQEWALEESMDAGVLPPMLQGATLVSWEEAVVSLRLANRIQSGTEMGPPLNPYVSTIMTTARALETLGVRIKTLKESEALRTRLQDWRWALELPQDTETLQLSPLEVLGVMDTCAFVQLGVTSAGYVPAASGSSVLCGTSEADPSLTLFDTVGSLQRVPLPHRDSVHRDLMRVIAGP